MSERDYETLFRFLCANIGGAGDLLALNEAEFARRIRAKDEELLKKYGRTTTAAERLEIANGPGLGYQTYSQWRETRPFVEDPTELYPKMEPFKSYHEWKQSQGQKKI